MDDIEKNRSEYVVMLEDQLKHAKRQLAEVQPLAEKWTPVVNTELAADGARITLQFGGKRVTATIGNSLLDNADLTSLTSGVIDTLCESLIVDRLREVVTPEVNKMMQNRSTTRGAGRW
jgi:hypothetical protein